MPTDLATFAAAEAAYSRIGPLEDQGRRAEALQEAAEAARLYAALFAVDPAKYLERLSFSWACVGANAHALGRLDEAEGAYRQALLVLHGAAQTEREYFGYYGVFLKRLVALWREKGESAAHIQAMLAALSVAPPSE
jgi:tetratricopeptide (TPR) repeat protein